MVKAEKCVCDPDSACCKDGEGVSGAREGRGQIRQGIPVSGKEVKTDEAALRSMLGKRAVIDHGGHRMAGDRGEPVAVRGAPPL